MFTLCILFTILTIEIYGIYVKEKTIPKTQDLHVYTKQYIGPCQNPSILPRRDPPPPPGSGIPGSATCSSHTCSLCLSLELCSRVYLSLIMYVECYAQQGPDLGINSIRFYINVYFRLELTTNKGNMTSISQRGCHLFVYKHQVDMLKQNETRSKGQNILKVIRF